MNTDKPRRYAVRCLLCVAALVCATPAPAVVPEGTIRNGAVHLKVVGPDNPILRQRLVVGCLQQQLFLGKFRLQPGGGRWIQKQVGFRVQLQE